MKAAATPKRSGKDNGTKPAANGNGHGGGPTSPPAAGATPAGDGENSRPSSHPLLSALSQYFGEYMRPDVDAILAIVEDRTDGLEGEILSLGESLAKLEAREGELAAALARGLEHTAGLAKSHEGLSLGVEQLGSRVGTLGGVLSDATDRLGGEITALAREIDRRMGDLRTASEEDRKNASLGFAELGRQLELLSNEGSTLRSTADAHETSLRRLESELAGSSARLESLSESVAGLSGELERIRAEQSNRNTLHHLATLATRIRAVFSTRGAA